MKNWLISALVAGLVFGLAPTPADAKRLGGGKSAGMQRSAPDKPAPTAPAANPNAANPNTAPNTAPAAAAAPAAGTAAAAATPKRSWMGPIAGLAAGLGLAALLGHFGLGGEFANLLMMVLLAGVAFFVIRLLMRRFGGGALRPAEPVPAAATAGVWNSGADTARVAQRASWAATPASGGTVSAAAASASAAPAASAAAASALPAGFDAEAFQRIAKTIFIRLQAANDHADLNDLRNFTTPELFASLRVDLLERGNAEQRTDVVTVDAQVLEFVQEVGRQIVSVRFHGLMREEADASAAPFDEIWHLVKTDDAAAWAIAGIQPSIAAAH